MSDASLLHAAEIWSRYWAGAPAEDSVCLPGLAGPVADWLADLWRQFFLVLPPGARVLDLGSGGGVLLRLARAQRPDLHLTGVDFAVELPDPGDGITQLSGVRMEALPCAAGSFDAVTSLFAIEYAAIEPAVSELLRVLDPVGCFQLICHHADGVIVRDNAVRRAAILSLLAPHGLLSVAIETARRRKSGAPATQQRLARVFEAACRKHPAASVVHEVGRDIARAVREGGGVQRLLHLRQDVAMEGERIAALERAALTEIRARDLADLLAAGGRSVTLRSLSAPGVTRPFAWFLMSQAALPPSQATCF